MKKNCSLCGNIFHNAAFRGGYVCEDCIEYIRQVDIEELPILQPINQSY